LDDNDEEDEASDGDEGDFISHRCETHHDSTIEMQELSSALHNHREPV